MGTIKTFPRPQFAPWKVLHDARILFSFVLLPTFIDASTRSSLAIGFDGDFANSTWVTSCGLTELISETFDCGFVSPPAAAVVTNAGPSDGTTPTISAWTNPSRPSGAYLISFDLSLSTGVGFYDLGDNYGYYQIGGSTFSPTGRVSGVSTLQVRDLYVSASQSITFGIYTTNSTLSPGVTEDLQLSITGFSATPVTPVTAPLVPAPLPAIGAASLFIGSRRLKKRIVRQRVLRLARRNLAPALRSVLPG
jgi:hypothetical protein